MFFLGGDGGVKFKLFFAGKGIRFIVFQFQFYLNRVGN